MNCSDKKAEVFSHNETIRVHTITLLRISRAWLSILLTQREVGLEKLSPEKKSWKSCLALKRIGKTAWH